MEDNENNDELNKNNKSTTIFLIIAIIILIVLIIFISKDSSTTSISSSSKPSNLKLMSYAQTILEDEYGNSISYSRSTSDYTFVETGLRYKIEGKFTKNGTVKNFYMVIKFTDETYTEYDLISLDTKFRY